MKQKERKERSAAQAVNPTATSSSTPIPPPPPPTSQPTLHVFHDSNLKHLTPDELNNSIKNINKHTAYNIIPYMPFTLPQTLYTIKNKTFKTNDIVVITVLTNDARNTQNRPARTPYQTQTLQSQIITHLKAFISPQHIIFLEAPPLLTTSSDIFPLLL